MDDSHQRRSCRSSNQPKGLKEISRGLRSATTIPPVAFVSERHPERVTESEVEAQRLPPFQGGKTALDLTGGITRELVQPPANIFHAFGVTCLVSGFTNRLLSAFGCLAR